MGSGYGVRPGFRFSRGGASELVPGFQAALELLPELDVCRTNTRSPALTPAGIAQ